MGWCCPTWVRGLGWNASSDLGCTTLSYEFLSTGLAWAALPACLPACLPAGINGTFPFISALCVPVLPRSLSVLQ